MLPPQALQEFKQIYRKVFGEELNDAEAERRANRLLNLYGVIFEHMTSIPNEKVKEHELRTAS
ncbi:MAG: hypothetical protein AAB794_02755 [Patescibacteria group bacterium]